MTPSPDQIKLFHITSYKNLRSIVYEHQALLCKQTMLEKRIGHIDIAYDTVQCRRAEITVPLPPHGNLHDYVPFSFCPRPVMLLPIKSGKVEQYQDGQGEIIYLITDYPTVSALDNLWVFTDGHAIMRLTDFYNNSSHFAEVDWKLLGSNSWGDTEDDNDRKRRKQAEFLIHRAFPWTGVKWIVSINEEVKAQVEVILQDATHKPNILVKRNYYY
jgi:hypothetical protein